MVQAFTKNNLVPLHDQVQHTNKYSGCLTAENFNSEADAGAERKAYFSSLFTRAKQIYKCAESGTCIDDATEKDLKRIKQVFHSANDYKGVIYTMKALAILHEARGNQADELQEKLKNYELANETINEAIIVAKQYNWVQPSLLKREGILKSKLGDTLHALGLHYDANIIEKMAFKVFTQLVRDYPEYAEARIDHSFWSLNKICRSLTNITISLDKAKALIDSPKHTRQLPDETEIARHKMQIADMQHTIEMLYKCFPNH